MWLLITFITIWAVSPGPVAVITLHESRKHGLMAGVAVSAGATLTSALMVLMGVIVHLIGFSAIIESHGMVTIERIGAIGIISMGIYAAYKSIWSVQDTNQDATPFLNKVGFIQGMMVMATYIPQALIYYNMIIPQTIEPDSILSAILLLGTLKVVLILGWHSGIAYIATRTNLWGGNNRFGKLFEVATAGLMMLLGINILF